LQGIQEAPISLAIDRRGENKWNIGREKCHTLQSFLSIIALNINNDNEKNEDQIATT
jgi:hypothetical protein